MLSFLRKNYNPWQDVEDWTSNTNLNLFDPLFFHSASGKRIITSTGSSISRFYIMNVMRWVALQIGADRKLKMSVHNIRGKCVIYNDKHSIPILITEMLCPTCGDLGCSDEQWTTDSLGFRPLKRWWHINNPDDKSLPMKQFLDETIEQNKMLTKIDDLVKRELEKLNRLWNQ